MIKTKEFENLGLIKIRKYFFQ